MSADNRPQSEQAKPISEIDAAWKKYSAAQLDLILGAGGMTSIKFERLEEAHTAYLLELEKSKPNLLRKATALLGLFGKKN